MEAKRFVNSNKDLFEQSKMELKNWVHNNRDIIEQAKMEYKRLPGAMKQGVRDVYYVRQLPRDIIIGLIAEQNRKKAAEKGLDLREFPTMEQVIINNRNAHTRDYLLQDVLIQGGMDWKKAFALNAALDVSNLGETVIKGIIEKPEKTIPAGIKGFTAVYQVPLAGMKALTAASNREMAKQFGYFDPKEHISGWEAFVDQMNPYQSPKYHLSAGLMQAMSTPPGAEKFPKIWYEKLPENVKALIAASPEALLQLFYLQQMGKGLMHKARTRIPSRFNPTLPGSRYIDKAGKYLNQDAGKFAGKLVNRMFGGNGRKLIDTKFDAFDKDQVFGSRRIHRLDAKLDGKEKMDIVDFKTKSGRYRTMRVFRYKDPQGKMPDLKNIKETMSKFVHRHLEGVDEIRITNSPLKRVFGSKNSAVRGYISSYQEGGRKYRVITLLLKRRWYTRNYWTNPQYKDYAYRPNDISGTIGHEIGHNVSFTSKAYKAQESIFRNAHSVHLKSGSFEEVMGKNVHFRNYDEWFAQMFRYSRLEPDMLRGVQGVLKETGMKINLLEMLNSL